MQTLAIFHSPCTRQTLPRRSCSQTLFIRRSIGSTLGLQVNFKENSATTSRDGDRLLDSAEGQQKQADHVTRQGFHSTQTSNIVEFNNTCALRSASSSIHAPDLSPPVTGVLAPAATFQKAVSLGVYKACTPMPKMFMLAVMAGCYISFGGLLMLVVCGNMPGLTASNPGLVKLIGALIFPVGLFMVIIGGADLFTGNTFVVTSALLENQISPYDLMRSWMVSYSGNLIGSLLIVAAVSCSGILSGNAAAIKMAEYKASLPLGQALVRGLLANWMVCIAVLHATTSSQLTEKACGLWTPIATFVAIGLEHSVANMFIIPMGMMLGAKVSIADFIFKNLIPVTIGNIAAGVFCMATVYSLCYGSGAKGWRQLIPWRSN